MAVTEAHATRQLAESHYCYPLGLRPRTSCEVRVTVTGVAEGEHLCVRRDCLTEKSIYPSCGGPVLGFQHSHSSSLDTRNILGAQVNTHRHKIKIIRKEGKKAARQAMGVDILLRATDNIPRYHRL